jgi:hypothetical protein
MSLKVGDIISAVVTNTANYGMFLRHGDDAILVLIPETSWTACYASCHQLADVGDEFEIVIVAVGADGRIAGSLRAWHPTSDPWSGAWQLKVGDCIDAKVARIVTSADRCNRGKGYLLELRPAAYAMLCADGLPELLNGQRCKVRVSDIDESRHAIGVKLDSTE